MKKVWMRCVESESGEYKVGRYYRLIPSIAINETFTEVYIGDIDRSKENLPKIYFVRVYWKEEIKNIIKKVFKC